MPSVTDANNAPVMTYVKIIEPNLLEASITTQKNHLELVELALRAIQYLYRIERICRDYGCSAVQRHDFIFSSI